MLVMGRSSPFSVSSLLLWITLCCGHILPTRGSPFCQPSFI